MNSPDVSLNSNTQPVFYLSHGGGPWPFMTGQFRQMFTTLEASLQALPSYLPQLPDAVLIISGHWEAPNFSVSTSALPTMIYDYYGFPQETYQVQYPAPGHPRLAEEIASMLEQHGHIVLRDTQRGYDHGTFCLMKPIFPSANIPIVQLAMKQSFDPHEHYAVGQILAKLRKQNILILGSGQSFHHLGVRGDFAKQQSFLSDKGFRYALAYSDAHARLNAVIDWMNSELGRFAHPRVDHLMPLFVVLGAALEAQAQLIFGDFILDFATTSVGFDEVKLPTNFDVFQTEM